MSPGEVPQVVAMGLGVLLLDVPSEVVHRSLQMGSNPSKTGQPQLAGGVTTMAESLLKATQHMGLKRVGLVVAGDQASAEKLKRHLEALTLTLTLALTLTLTPTLEAQGLQVVATHAMALSNEEAMANASQVEIIAACQAVASEDVDGVLIGSRTITTCGKGLLPSIEAAVGMPVVSAMQASSS